MEEVIENGVGESISIYYWINAVVSVLIALLFAGYVIFEFIRGILFYQGKMSISEIIQTPLILLLVFGLCVVLIKFGTSSLRKEEFRNNFFLQHARVVSFLFFFLITLIICQASTDSSENYSAFVTMPLLICLILIELVSFILGIKIKKQEIGMIAKTFSYISIVGCVIGIFIELGSMVNIIF